MPKLSAYVRRSREEKPCAGYGLHDAPASCLQDDKRQTRLRANKTSAAPKVYRQPDGTLGDTKPPNTSRSQVARQDWLGLVEYCRSLANKR
ncbi:hypothetical protein WJX84_009857 [Apatococcus fuscideae]|uniref:Uncharacterized protein n=1 Tax=Apatococcus fuscideae TaxID=2026836 RepID=A0AAW1SZZ7_9CHLO